MMAGIEKTPANGAPLRPDVAAADEALLASLGYKQEFKRHFTPLEVFGVSFSIIGIFPSIA